MCRNLGILGYFMAVPYHIRLACEGEASLKSEKVIQSLKGPVFQKGAFKFKYGLICPSLQYRQALGSSINLCLNGFVV